MTKILLVEDDERIVAFLKRGLTAEGFVVDVAANGEVALALCHDYDYPLVILDVMLPILDGIEVCRALRRQSKQSLVLMLTANDSAEFVTQGFAAGSDDYITKPFRRDDLVARVRRMIERTYGRDSIPGQAASAANICRTPWTASAVDLPSLRRACSAFTTRSPRGR